jgi:hypothetical protein
MENIILCKGGVATAFRSQDVWRLSPMASLLGALVGVAQDIETLLLPLKLRGSEEKGGGYGVEVSHLITPNTKIASTLVVFVHVCAHAPVSICVCVCVCV